MLHPDDMPDLSPEGTSCRAHEERQAFCRCPRCGAHVCGLCWFDEHRRCHRCVVAAPEELSPPLAWESIEGSFGSRLLATMRSALSPSRSAAAFAFGSVSRAALFFAITFIPFALARGVIPYTKLVEFGPTFAIRLKHGATASGVALDVARASGISFIESFTVFLALLVCYRSLASAFGRPGSGEIATRVALYRGFLLPLGAFLPTQMSSGVTLLPDGLLLSLGFWFMPARADVLILAALLLSIVPAVLVFVSMRNVARIVVGVETLASFLLAFVPWAFSVIVFGLVHAALAPLIPPITFQ